MKKSAIVLLLLVGLLLGCTPKDEMKPKKNWEGQQAIVSTFVKEKDLKSYALEIHSEEILGRGSPEKEKIQGSDGEMEVVREPFAYHVTWKAPEESGVVEMEEYRIGHERFTRKNQGQWKKEVLAEPSSEGAQKQVFKNSFGVNQRSLLEELGEYFQVEETPDAYLATLASDETNLEAIKDRLFRDGKENPLYHNLTAITAAFSFRKEDGIPLSYKWELHFADHEEARPTTIKQWGEYHRVNDITSIELPEELKHL